MTAAINFLGASIYDDTHSHTESVCVCERERERERENLRDCCT